MSVEIFPAPSRLDAVKDIQDDIETDIEQESVSASDIADVLSSRNSFEYKNEYKKSIPSKISASELSHKLSEKVFERIMDTPAFMSESTLTPAQRGTALHAFMQFCDFVSARQDINAEIERLKDKGYISSLQADSIDKEKASRFINSELITRALNSEKVFKEYRFAIKVKASRVSEDVNENYDDEIILQGAVDLAFVENGELVIVDYKTDRVKDTNALYSIYHNQLKIYKEAMEQCTDYKVKECMIYSIHNGDYIYI
jgi:ATP-dependent helicase/nuclease subunit A